LAGLVPAISIAGPCPAMTHVIGRKHRFVDDPDALNR
jgi:hypothetical protein